MQERCVARETNCKEALAKTEKTQKETATTVEGVKEGLQALTNRVGEIAASLELMTKCIGQTEDRFTHATVEIASEHAAMKLKLEDLSTRIETVLFQDTLTGLGQQRESSHPQQQRKQQQQQKNPFKPPHHLSVSYPQGAADTNPDYLLRRCNSLNSAGTPDDCSSGTPSYVSLVAVPTPCLAADGVAELTNNIGTLVQGNVDMLQYTLQQLPRTGHSSDAKQAKEPGCPSEAADAACTDCELRQIEPDLLAPETRETCSSVPCQSSPSSGVVNAARRMPAQIPRRQPRLTAAKQVTAPDLGLSQVILQENEIGQATACENDGSQTPHFPKRQSSKEPPPALEELMEEEAGSPVTSGTLTFSCSSRQSSQVSVGSGPMLPPQKLQHRQP